MRRSRTPWLFVALLLGTASVDAAQVLGIVRRSDTNAPIPVATVRALVQQPGGEFTFAGFGLTDVNGNYALTLNFAPNNYYVFVDASGFVAELYDNVPCTVVECDINQATAVPIAATGFAANINFALDLAPQISGVVRREDTLTPIEGVRVQVVGPDGVFGASALTGADGGYTLSLPVGGAYVIAGGAPGFVHELHPGVLCPYGQCDRTGGTLFDLAPGQTQAGVDFALLPGGAMSGSVTRSDTGMPVESGVSIDVYANGTDLLTTVVAEADGSWTTASELPTGNYRVRARVDQFYAWQMYQARECTGANFDECDIAAGDNVAVSAGVVTQNINFALRRVVASLAGRVTELATGAPLANVLVDARRADNSIVAQAFTDGAGDWRIDNLLPGTYSVFANSPGAPLLSEFFPGVQCLPSMQCGGVPTSLVLGAGNSVDAIDFALAPLAEVDLGLRNADTATLMAGEIRARLPGVDTDVNLFTATGARTTLPVLSGGLVRFAGTAVVCGASEDRVCLAERYPDTACAHFSCGLDNGSMLSVPKGATLPAIDLELGAGASIAGHVRAAQTLDPIANSLIEVSTGDVIITSTISALDGGYRVDGLSTGPYFVRTRTPTAFLDELYDNLPCALGTCNAATGTAVSPPIAGTTNAVDFELAPGAGIRGHVRDALTAQTITGARVSVFDALGQQIAGMSSLSDGSYLSPALPAGSYFLRAERVGYETVLYQNLPCPAGACTPTSGTPVTVTPPNDTQDIDFALPQDSTPRPRTVMYLNRCADNCTVTRGADDSRFNRSSIVSGTRVLPPYPYDQASFDALVACMREVWQPYNVEIVTSDPTPAAHQELMLSTTPSVAGFSPGVAGVSPFTCGTIPNAITFLFASAHPDDTDELCHTAAMELAHSFGLDHEVQCSDPMTYLSGCGRKRFTDIDAPCGEYGPRSCTCGGAAQNSHRFLQGAVGVNPLIFSDSFEASPPAAPKRVSAGPPMVRLPSPNAPHCGTREQPVQTLLETWWWEGYR